MNNIDFHLFSLSLFLSIVEILVNFFFKTKSAVEIPNIHKQDTLDKLKEFNARRRLKVSCCAIHFYKLITKKICLRSKNPPKEPEQ